jgi:hypothetical protein
VREQEGADVGEAWRRSLVLEVLVGGPHLHGQPVGAFVGGAGAALSSRSAPWPAEPRSTVTLAAYKAGSRPSGLEASLARGQPATRTGAPHTSLVFCGITWTSPSGWSMVTSSRARCGAGEQRLPGVVPAGVPQVAADQPGGALRADPDFGNADDESACSIALARLAFRAAALTATSAGVDRQIRAFLRPVSWMAIAQRGGSLDQLV